MADYTKQDLEDSLRRAFVDGKADFILYDGHEARNEFLREGITLGLENGWLVGKEKNEEQWTTIEYRLTEKGKEYFKLN